MPATKLRREQLNISLNDLLWLDRQKVGGSLREIRLNSGEDFSVRNSSGSCSLSILDIGSAKLKGDTIDLSFISLLRIIDENSSDILFLSHSANNFSFSTSINLDITANIIKLNHPSLGTVLEVNNNGLHRYVKVDNKLGVGLEPTYALDVNGDIRSFGDFLSSKTSAVNIGTLTNQPVKIITNNTPVIYVGNNGNVGIGTTAPGAKLHLVDFSSGQDVPIACFGDGGSSTRYQWLADLGSGATFHINAGTANIRSSGTLALQYGGANTALFISSSGSVGIGTTAPAYKLDVIGDIRCFGNLLSSKTSAVDIGTLTNQAVRIITNNTARVIIPTSGYITFNLPVRMNEGIVVDWEKRENLKILNQEQVTYWFEYNSIDHGVNGWGSWNPSQGIGKVFRFMDTMQVLVLLNGQVLTQGSINNGNIVNGDYVFISATNSPITNGKALVLAEQPQSGDIVRIVGFFSVYEY